MLDCHRPSLLQPCTSLLHVREEHHGKEPRNSVLGPSSAKEDRLGQNTFDRTEQDNKLAPSVENEIFLRIMDKCKGWHKCEMPLSPDELYQTREVIIRAVQRKAFEKEFEALERDKPAPLNSCLHRLNPILRNDLICLGGRLKNADVEIEQKNPVILPKENHVSLLLIRHHHAQLKHQGHHLTEGAVRAAGLWSLGGKGLIDSTLHKCVTCRRLRGQMQEQQMAEVAAIMNAKLLVPVSNYPEDPFILTASMLLTQKAGVPPPPEDFTDRDLLTKQWRQVQALSNMFWSRWRQVYLSTLHNRKKWKKRKKVPPKSTRRRRRPSQRQPSCPQPLAFGGNHKSYSWRRWKSP